MAVMWAHILIYDELCQKYQEICKIRYKYAGM